MSEPEEVREKDRRRFNFISVMEGAILLALGGVTALMFQTRETVIRQTVQLEAINETLSQMRTGLGDVPTIRSEMAELKVRVDRHDEDLRELRQMKGLK